MPYIKGQSGNPMGRPKGSINKTTFHLRGLIADFLTSNFNKITTDFESLQPKERLRFYCELLQFGLPKLQTTLLESQYESIPEEQLDKIISELISNQPN
jgi:hypothetical protein